VYSWTYGDGKWQVFSWNSDSQPFLTHGTKKTMDHFAMLKPHEQLV